MLLAALAALALQEGWSGFPAFLWRQRQRGGAPPPAELLEGFGGVDLKRSDAGDWLAGLDLYLDQAPGRNDLHLDADMPGWSAAYSAWLAERGAAHLVREPCLTDPATRARLEETLRESLGRHAARHPLFASLGDEISLTPSQGMPWDGCRSATCRAAWDARRGAPDAPMPTTDEARLAWTRGDTAHIGAWLDLRRFHRGVVEDEVVRLAAVAHAAAPGMPLGVLGTIGATPFGGLDLRRMAKTVEVIECYPEGDARAELETLRTRRPGVELRSLRTVFLIDESPAGGAWQVAEHWVRGGDGVVVWCDEDVEQRPAHGAALRAALADARDLRGRYPDFRPAPAGVAVLRDDDARALVFLAEACLDGPTWPNRFPSYQEQHGAVERSVRGWLRLCEDLGFQPGVARFGALDARRFPVLVLPHVRVLDERDREELERFLAAGGVLLVDGELGGFDRAGRPRAGDLCAELAERYPGRALTASTESYPERRLALDPERRRAFLPRAAWDALAAAGHAPLCLADEAGLPWLVTRAPLPGGGLLVAAVPNLSTQAERAKLADARVRPPAPPPGLELRPVRPAALDDGVLAVPAGSALVFELAPTR